MKYPWTMFNSLRPSDAYMRHETKPSLIQIVACRLAGASHHLKQCGIMWIGPWGTNFNNILVEIHHFHSRKCVWICRLQKKWLIPVRPILLIVAPDRLRHFYKQTFSHLKHSPSCFAMISKRSPDCFEQCTIESIIHARGFTIWIATMQLRCKVWRFTIA